MNESPKYFCLRLSKIVYLDNCEQCVKLGRCGYSSVEMCMNYNLVKHLKDDEKNNGEKIL